MNTSLQNAVAFFGIIFALGVEVPRSYHPALFRSPCGHLIRWKLPETTVVERTADDDRSVEVLMTQARLDALILTAEAYCRLSGGAYPRTYQDMTTALPGMIQCALDTLDVSDAWDRPIYYSVSAGHPILESAGADGRFTTADDIGWPKMSDPHTEKFEIPAACRGP